MPPPKKKWSNCANVPSNPNIIPITPNIIPTDPKLGVGRHEIQEKVYKKILFGLSKV